MTAQYFQLVFDLFACSGPWYSLSCFSLSLEKDLPFSCSYARTQADGRPISTSLICVCFLIPLIPSFLILIVSFHFKATEAVVHYNELQFISGALTTMEILLERPPTQIKWDKRLGISQCSNYSLQEISHLKKKTKQTLWFIKMHTF